MALTSSQVDTITRTVLGEALPNDPTGAAAVASVIKNRSESGQFPSDPAAVALQKNQFSANNPVGQGGNTEGSAADPNSARYQQVAAIVQGVFNGSIPDPTNGATYYHTPAVHPDWDRSMTQTAALGGHIFYSPHPIPPANIPTQPNASGAPDDRSATAYSPSNVTPIPLAPQRVNVSGSPDDRDSLPFSYSAPAAPASPLKNVSGSPDDRDSTAPISATAAPAPQTVTTKNGTYVVGQTYQLADGASYRANADGSFTKTASTPRNPTPIQLAIESQVPGAQANLNSTISAAKGVASMGATAVSGLGSLFGNLFGHGAAAAPVAANSSGSPDDRSTSPVPSLPDPYKPSSGPFSYPAAAPNSSGSPDDRNGSRQNTADGIAGTVQLPSGVRPSIPSTTPSGGNSSSSSSQGGGYYAPPANNDLPFSYAAPPSSYAPPAANSSGSPDDRGTTYATQTVRVANPAYTAWMNNQSPISPFTNPGVQGLSPDDRDSPDGIARAVPGLNNPVFNMPAPPKTIAKIVRVPVASRPQASAAPVAAAPIAPVPIASTNGYTYLPNGSGGYTRVGSVNPSVSPAAQYAAAAAPALASQPSGGYAMANQPGGGSRNDTFNVD